MRDLRKELVELLDAYIAAPNDTDAAAALGDIENYITDDPQSLRDALNLLRRSEPVR